MFDRAPLLLVCLWMLVVSLSLSLIVLGHGM
jgi:hypothetical protein